MCSPPRPHLLERHQKKAKTNKFHFNPLPLLTGAEQDGSVGSGKLEAFISRCCSWELGQVLPGDPRSCFCQWHLQGLVIGQHSPKRRAISSKRNRTPSFSDTGLLHAWSPMKWGGRGLQGLFQLADTLIHSCMLHQASPSPCSPRGYTVLPPAQD